jgi:alpha-tubulin suppressor-like RCC1 family protein
VVENTLTVRTMFTTLTSKIKQISVGPYHTLILMSDGTVYSCGLPAKGRLGRDTGNIPTLPILFPGVVDVIAAGESTSHFLSGNELYSFGDYISRIFHFYSSLAAIGITGLTQDLYVPTKVPSISNITDMRVAKSSVYLSNNKGVMILWIDILEFNCFWDKW